jgi:tRNA nucleotidyltransferase (CCA-adding enzyme)
LLRFISPYLLFDKDEEKLFNQMHIVYKWYELLYKGKPCDKLAYYVLGLTDHMRDEEVADFCKKTEMADRLRKRTLENVLRVRDVTTPLAMSFQSMKKSQVYRLIEPLSQEGRLFMMAKTRSEEIKKAISNYITYTDSLKPILTGRDLRGMGIKEGPVYKEILDGLRDAKVDMNLKTKEEESSFVRTYLAKKGAIL